MSRRSEAREKRARDQWATDLKWLAAAPQGRRIVANLLAWTHYGETVFTGNSHGNFMQGEQNIGNRLANEIKAVALADFHRMEVERLSAQQQIAAETSADDDAE